MSHSPNKFNLSFGLQSASRPKINVCLRDCRKICLTKPQLHYGALALVQRASSQIILLKPGDTNVLNSCTQVGPTSRPQKSNMGRAATGDHQDCESPLRGLSLMSPTWAWLCNLASTTRDYIPSRTRISVQRYAGLQHTA